MAPSGRRWTCRSTGAETARSCRSPAVSLNAAAIGRRSGWLRAAFRGIPLQAAYCGGKHAIVGFTESVITELLYKHSKVRVAMVHMPALNTIQFN